MMLKKMVGLTDLFTRFLRGDAQHDANRLAIVDVKSLQELVGIGVLLEVEQRVLGNRLKLLDILFQSLTKDEKGGGDFKAVVQLPGRFEELPRYAFTFFPRLHVVTEQHGSRHGRSSSA